MIKHWWSLVFGLSHSHRGFSPVVGKRFSILANRFNGFPYSLRAEAVETATNSKRLPGHRAKATV
jgi:hypothetical protein